ncbi:MAG TPA: YkgJ family cysteine cluster protein [Chlamydiales bacterium]|nr:YkgJ family cysteine cluster protein [Chlamydiales bacterium]
MAKTARGELLMEVNEPWFSDGLRFKCTGCGKCCTGSPGYVYLSETDLNRLSNHFQLTPQDFLKTYGRQIEEQYALLDRPGSHDCIFLKNNQCTVYDARPTQCRTFPWWIYNLRDPSDWEEASARCEGINHPDAPLVPSLQIQEQCMIYLDNLLDQNFTL